jgi:hypothetical protein
MAGTAHQTVTAKPAGQRVMVPTTIERIGQAAACEYIRECIARDRESLTGNIAHYILNTNATQAEDGAPQQNQIRTLPASLPEYIALTHNKHIIAIAAPHGIGAVTAIQRVIAIATNQAIIACAARKTIGKAITQ